MPSLAIIEHKISPLAEMDDIENPRKSMALAISEGFDRKFSDLNLTVIICAAFLDPQSCNLMRGICAQLPQRWNMDQVDQIISLLRNTNVK